MSWCRMCGRLWLLTVAKFWKLVMTCVLTAPCGKMQQRISLWIIQYLCLLWDQCSTQLHRSTAIRFFNKFHSDWDLGGPQVDTGLAEFHLTAMHLFYEYKGKERESSQLHCLELLCVTVVVIFCHSNNKSKFPILSCFIAFTYMSNQNFCDH